MTEKYSSEKRVTDQETSRRGFLKTSASLAGAALLGSAFNTANVSAAEKSSQDGTEAQLLFVQNAKDVDIKDGRLSLIGISPTTIFFATGSQSPAWEPEEYQNVKPDPSRRPLPTPNVKPDPSPLLRPC